jgi:hypothetical protein
MRTRTSSPPEHDLQKNAALLVKQKLLREEIFKLILPSAQAAAYVVDMLEMPNNFQDYVGTGAITRPCG